MTKLKTYMIVLALVPNLFALDVETLDGKTYKNCTVSKVEPDAICLLFSGGGARVKFVNLPKNIRISYGYDAEKAAAYQKAQSLKRQREDAVWLAARWHAEARRKATESNALAMATSANQVAERSPLAYGGGNRGQGGYGGNSQYGGGYSSGGSEYVGVTLANGGVSGFGRGGGGFGSGNQGSTGGSTGMGTVYYGVRLAPR